MYKPVSALSSSIENYIKFKHALGFKYDNQRYYLFELDKANYQLGNFDYVDKNVMETLLKNLINRCKCPNKSYVSCYRQFCRYMYEIDNKSYIVDDKYIGKHYHADNYLLSNNEIKQFFITLNDYCSNLKNIGDRLILPVVFKFLYFCGVRCVEARKLKTSDVNLEEGYVDIKYSKNYGDRRIYINDEVINVFKEYNFKMSSIVDNREYFFSQYKDKCRPSSFISVNFRRIWIKAGFTIDINPRPRAYDFRHHFACANIIKWVNEGKNVHAMLPYLMTYMGHSSLDSTYYYIHLLPDFFQKYKELSSISDELVPEVEDYEI